MRSLVRTGIVLAARRSRRLSGVTGGSSKMLHRLGGEPLVARATRSLLALGLERVLVIVGHDADEGAGAARLDPRVQVVPAPDWKLGNGASLAAAAEYVREDELFLVICGEHVFSVGARAD